MQVKMHFSDLSGFTIEGKELRPMIYACIETIKEFHKSNTYAICIKANQCIKDQILKSIPENCNLQEDNFLGPKNEILYGFIYNEPTNLVFTTDMSSEIIEIYEFETNKTLIKYSFDKSNDKEGGLN